MSKLKFKLSKLLVHFSEKYTIIDDFLKHSNTRYGICNYTNYTIHEKLDTRHFTDSNITFFTKIKFFKVSLVQLYVTASAKRLYRDIGVEELVPWIWSGTKHHDISSLCPPKDSRSRGGATVSRDALWPDTSL